MGTINFWLVVLLLFFCFVIVVVVLLLLVVASFSIYHKKARYSIFRTELEWLKLISTRVFMACLLWTEEMFAGLILM